jgi:hypothetical protein
VLSTVDGVIYIPINGVPVLLYPLHPLQQKKKKKKSLDHLKQEFKTEKIILRIYSKEIMNVKLYLRVCL